MSTPSTIIVARTDRARDAAGKPLQFSPADLDGMVAAYDGAAEPAPITLGPPKTEDPAYGWVESLKRVDGTVVATLSDVEPAFAQRVRDGRYPEVRPSFYRPDEPNNPRPGAWYLRNVAFGPVNPGVMPSPAQTTGAARSVTRPAAVAPVTVVPIDDQQDIPARIAALQAAHPKLSVLQAYAIVQQESDPTHFGAPAGYKASDGGDVFRRALRMQALRPGSSIITLMAGIEAADEAMQRVRDAGEGGDPAAMRDALAFKIQSENPGMAMRAALALADAIDEASRYAASDRGQADPMSAANLRAWRMKAANPGLTYAEAFRRARAQGLT